MYLSEKALGLFHLFEIIYFEKYRLVFFGLLLFTSKQVNLTVKCGMVTFGAINLVHSSCYMQG